MRYKTIKHLSQPTLKPPCSKTIYQTKEEAEDIIKHINETRVTKDIRAYRCMTCGFWHLTSKGR